MNHSPSSEQSGLSDERINELALLNLGYDRAIRPLDFARAIEREVRAAASAHAIGEDAANVAIGEREAFLTWWCADVPEYMREKWKESVDECLRNNHAQDKLVGAWDGFQFGLTVARAALTAEKVAAEPPIPPSMKPDGSFTNHEEWRKAEVIASWRRVAEDARRTSEYWKAEHLAGNKEIEKLNEANKLLHEQLDTARSTIGALRDQAAQIAADAAVNHSRTHDHAKMYAADAIARDIRNLPEQPVATQPVAQTLALTDEQLEDLQEAREILENMVRSVELDGNYSTEATCTFLRQALLCLPAAQPASGGESC